MLLLLLCASMLFIYSPIWHGQFVYDDLWYIVRNPFIHHRLSFVSLFTDAGTTAAPASGLSTDIYRPLTTLWFWIDAHLWGPDTLPYHIENLLLHAINGFLIFTLLRRWMGNSTAALAGCAVFLLHPVQVQSVAWITQRSSLASTACLLAALLFLTNGPQRIARGQWILGILAACAALLFRETPIVLPLLYGIVVSSQAKTPFVERWKDRGAWRNLLVMVGLCALYLGVRQAVVGQWSQLSEQSGSWMGNAGLGILAFPVYLGKIVLPLKLRASYSYPALDPALIGLSFILWIFYAASVFYFARRDRWTATGLLWIWAGLLPVLQIIPIRAFVTERFLYMPLVGVAIVVCSIARRIQGRWLYLPWLFFLMAMTWRAIPAWKDEQSLWAEAVKHDPGNAFAHLCYGGTLSDPAAASEQYRQVLLSHPNVDQQFAAANNLASVLLGQGKNGEALFWARKAADERPESAEALYNLALASLRTGHRREAMSVLGHLERLLGKGATPVQSLRQEFDSLS